MIFSCFHNLCYFFFVLFARLFTPADRSPVRETRGGLEPRAAPAHPQRHCTRLRAGAPAGRRRCARKPCQAQRQAKPAQHQDPEKPAEVGETAKARAACGPACDSSSAKMRHQSEQDANRMRTCRWRGLPVVASPAKSPQTFSLVRATRWALQGIPVRSLVSLLTKKAAAWRAATSGSC